MMDPMEMNLPWLSVKKKRIVDNVCVYVLPRELKQHSQIYSAVYFLVSRYKSIFYYLVILLFKHKDSR